MPHEQLTFLAPIVWHASCIWALVQRHGQGLGALRPHVLRLLLSLPLREVLPGLQASVPLTPHLSLRAFLVDKVNDKVINSWDGLKDLVMGEFMNSAGARPTCGTWSSQTQPLCRSPSRLASPRCESYLMLIPLLAVGVAVSATPPDLSPPPRTSS